MQMPFRKKSPRNRMFLGGKSGCLTFDNGLDDKAYQEHQKGDCTVQQTVGIPGEGRDGVHVGSENDEIYVVRHGTENSDADGSDHDRIQCADPLLGTPGIFGAVPFADEMPDDQYGGQNTHRRQKISQNGQQIEQNICDVCHEIILQLCHSEEPTEGRRRGNLLFRLNWRRLPRRAKPSSQ